MKTLLPFLFLLVSIATFAQQTQKFYDYNWKECDVSMARFVAIIKKTDSGWHRSDYFLHSKKLQMDGTYSDEACEKENGKFYYYHANGVLEKVGNYVNDKKDGLWLEYHTNGMMSDSTTYKNGKIIGTSIGWYANGYPKDSSVVNEDGTNVSVEWFDDGNVSSAGRFNANEKRIGKWQFFHKNGRMSALETYENGKVVDKQNFTETGEMVIDTATVYKNASFKGGINAWQKYLYKGLYFPERYTIVNSDKAVVVVSFVIDEEGNVTDVFASTPFHPDFDKIAVEQIKSSPKWLPAVSHNRKVKHYLRQPVIFSQE
jgi:antitoxin component YwqK of YwqJK toxin-antitoxin module